MASKEVPILRIPDTATVKFTIENRGYVGGDWERNIGGMKSDRRITFEGEATHEICAALIDAIGRIAD